MNNNNTNSNNNHSTNNNGGHDSSTPSNNVVSDHRKNDNESASEILSELDLVASINIGLNNLKKQQELQQQQGKVYNNTPLSSSSTVEGGSGCSGASLDESKVITNPFVIMEKMSVSDAYLSGIKPESLKHNNNNLRPLSLSSPNTPETMRKQQMLLRRKYNKFLKYTHLDFISMSFLDGNDEKNNNL